MNEDDKKEIASSMRQILLMNPELAQECIDYILTQLNRESFLGVINPAEYAILVRNAVSGLNRIIYLKHYSRDLVSKHAFMSACVNLIVLLYTRPLDGNDRKLLIEEFRSKTPVMVTNK